MRIGVIRNPKANKNRRGKNPLQDIHDAVGNKSLVFETENVEDDLKRAIWACCISGVDVICSDGGDGTAHHTLTKLISIYSERKAPLPMFVPLASGTVNFAAKALGTYQNPVSYLEQLVAKDEPETQDIDVLKVDTLGGTKYGFAYAAGAVTNFMEKYYDPNISGFLSYQTSVRKACGLLAHGILSAIFDTSFAREIMHPAPIEIFTENEYSENPVAVLASTMPASFIGIKPFHAIAAKKNGVYVLHGNFSSDVIIKNLPRAFLGKKPEGEGLHIGRSAHVKVYFKEECAYTIDGDIYVGKKNENIALVPGPSIRIPKL